MLTILCGFFILFGTTDAEAATTRYTVVKGDSIYLISQNYGVKQQDIIDFNGLKNTIIYPGQILLIPAVTQTTASRAGNSRSYSSVSEQDKLYLAQAVYGEARGESYEGQVAVAAVILNRVKNSDFPNTIREVIFEPWAFTAVNDGQFYLRPDATAMKAVEDALSGRDPSGGALYYWNPDKATSKWIWTRSIIARIGNHVFGI